MVKAIETLRQAIAQAEQEQPVAWLLEAYDIFNQRTLQRVVFTKPENMQFVKVTPYYNAQSTRKPLTDEQIDLLDLPKSGTATMRDLVRLIEKAHKIGG
jgi:hypothetical protein